MLQTEFTRLFTLRYPIMQAPMGGVAAAQLVAAVSNAGALGMMAAVGLPPENLRAEIRRVRELTSHAFGVNLLLPVLLPGQFEVCLEERVPLLSLFWGDPGPYVAAAHAAGSKVTVQVGSAEEAMAARDAGVDLIIAQGVEAGGHVRGTVGTLPLVPIVVDAVRPTPVIATGGLGDGRALVAVLALGAAGGAFGTRFLVCTEAAADPEYKRRVIAASAEDTYYTTLFDFGWPDAPHRVLRNSVVDEWERAGRPPSGQRPGEGEIIGEMHLGEVKFPVPRYSAMPPSAEFHGDVEKTALYVGQSCGLVKDIQPAATVVEQIAREAESVLGQLRTLGG